VQHLSTSDLIEGLVKLYIRLIDLGVESRNSRVYLGELDRGIRLEQDFTVPARRASACRGSPT
jgi:hypothetical protein